MIAKTILSVLLSALLIGLAPNEASPAHLNNSVTQDEATKPLVKAEQAQLPSQRDEVSPTPATPTEPERPQAQAQVAVQTTPSPVDDQEALLAAAGVPSNEWAASKYVFFKESTWRPAAINEIGCIGLGQNCPDKNGRLWLKEACPNWETDPVCQIKRFSIYAKERYGGWWAAYEFWLANGWW
jgi:hypothetical protein